MCRFEICCKGTIKIWNTQIYGVYICTIEKNVVPLHENLKIMAGKKYFYFVIQSWMLDEMGLPLSEAAVYAYIHGLTESTELEQKGWRGSHRRLAKVLHVSPSTMNDIINRLKKKGYVREWEGCLKSLIHRELPKSEAPKIGDVRNPDTF